MNKTYYIGHFLKDFNDGGQSRNKAFRDYFVKQNAIIPLIYSKNPIIRLGYLLNFLKVILFSKNNKFFIHQGTLLVLFPIPVLKINFIREFIFRRLQYLSNHNEVTIEVNDLPYEQSKDLELPVDEIYKVFQDKLYTLRNTKYVFASHEMGKYVNSNFNLSYDVIINGSNIVEDFSKEFSLNECFLSNQTKYIYAGGLNKGRQIESLISTFYNREEILILIGEWGDWLKDYNLSKNIFYLGKFEEKYAQYLSSKCDIGIIPYDDNRFYYNICYPTKASFYITAGIPFLSTPLLELKNVFDPLEMVFFVAYNDWKVFMDNFDKTSLSAVKEKIQAENYKFCWDELLENYFKNNN